MPHIIVEYSGGLSSSLNIPTLVEALHSCAMSIEALPVGGLRVRTSAAQSYKVGDGAADREFIYTVVRLGQGRTEETKRDIGDRLFAVLTAFTQPHFDAGKPLSLGLEIQEIEKDWTWKKNNIHQIIKDEHND